MSKVVLGHWMSGGEVTLDFLRLLTTRMLIQANSGGGKSWLLRVLFEITASLVQQLIIDPEGEFASLREQHDLIIIAANGGDAVAHPRTAALLAHRLLETKASAVLDISELRARDRHTFVRLFFEALIDAPKDLRHPVLVALDEAQMFAPEKGQGESEATDAVIDIATRGRKRGLCLVAATQRISMFHKGVAAELKNRAIGGTSLDVDVKRAAFDLGMPAKDALTLLRSLNPGHFLAFGPAFDQIEPREFIAGAVRTSHPKVGHKTAAPPKPTEAIKAILPKLADLPQEVEERARTLDDMKRELADAKRELLKAQRQPATDPKALERATHDAYSHGFSEGQRSITEKLEVFYGSLESWSKSMPLAPVFKLSPEPIGSLSSGNVRYVATARSRPPPVRIERPKSNGLHVSRDLNAKLSGGAKKILAILSQFPDGCEKGKLTLLTGYRYSGGFRNMLSELRANGCIEGPNEGVMRITPEGWTYGPFPELPQGQALIDYWLNHPSFGKAAKAILGELATGRELTAEQLSKATGYEYSGGFRNALSELRTAGVLVGANTGRMRISPEIVP